MILPFVGLDASSLRYPNDVNHITLVNTTFQLIENKERKHFMNVHLGCPRAGISQQLAACRDYIK